jgi:hypothetical protein
MCFSDDPPGQGRGDGPAGVKMIPRVVFVEAVAYAPIGAQQRMEIVRGGGPALQERSLVPTRPGLPGVRGIGTGAFPQEGIPTPQSEAEVHAEFGLPRAVAFLCGGESEGDLQGPPSAGTGAEPPKGKSWGRVTSGPGGWDITTDAAGGPSSTGVRGWSTR